MQYIVAIYKTDSLQIAVSFHMKLKCLDVNIETGPCVDGVGCQDCWQTYGLPADQPIKQ